MKCPLGYHHDHQVTWRCLAAYALDWLLGFDHWPDWIECQIVRALIHLEDR